MLLATLITPMIPRFLLGSILPAAIGAFSPLSGANGQPESQPVSWPAVTQQCKPWTYWWWMGSAVDRENITRQLTSFRDAGLGGVHIVPIYGVNGSEKQFISYLTPKWMEMLGHTVAEAQRLGLGVDMSTGSGWCFGGPTVGAHDANALVVAKTSDSAVGYQVTQKPSGVKVKRPGPGGEGPMLNLIYPDAMDRYLERFTAAFKKSNGPKPRAMYHDSYEYKSNWAPDFFAQFEKRRGYPLQSHLPALFGKVEDDLAARVKCDYRETLSDCIGESLSRWTNWSHGRGFVTRNQAHGSPGNLLDLYAAADIPETEMFGRLSPPSKGLSRNPLIAKFASSAAHVTGKNLASSETGTWVAEHFQETLADLKLLFDDMLVSGVNHVFYHGAAYSPESAAWPGWCFYAATQMNPRNSIWRDAPALNAYAARCQSVLQAGKPDGDVLLYWPIYDLWHDAKGMVQPLTVHAGDWFERQAIGKAAQVLWDRGYAFDYISDKQLKAVRMEREALESGGNRYRAVVIPACEKMPVETLRKLIALATDGATVVFEAHLPSDVPGLGDLESRRADFKKLLGGMEPAEAAGVREAKVGAGRVMIGALEAALVRAEISRESMTEQAGIAFVRRVFEDGSHAYFIANRGTKPLDGWVTPGRSAHSAVLMNPMSGAVGAPKIRVAGGSGQIYLQLEPGESIIVQMFAEARPGGPEWRYREPAGPSSEIKGTWQMRFLEGGPTLPKEFSTERLASWTESGGEAAQSFAGTVLCTITFDAPGSQAGSCAIDLGRVCQSARVRLNGSELGTFFILPFRTPAQPLKAKGNLLEVEVTSTSANRVRDLDLRQAPWKIFQDINIVSLDYKPFDASRWPVSDSGLLGPVTLIPQK